MSLLVEKVMNLPAVPGVYLFKDDAGRVIYVGKAKSLANRVRQYLVPDEDPWRQELKVQARDLDTVMTGSEVEALLLESTLIRQHRPRFNILLTDDKSFPYVKLSVQEEFPRLSVTRQVLNDGARYLGPFTDVKALRRTLREIRRVFPVRTCRDFEEHRRTNRPCLYFHIRRCTGPCTTRTQVAPAEYRALVDQLLWFLTGRDTELLDRLRAEMAEAAEAKRYELAARRRDQISLLESVRRPQDMVRGRGRDRDADVLGVARHGSGGAVTALLLRGGRVVGKETRVLSGAGQRSPQEILESFLAQHYLARQEVPRRIWVAEVPAGAEVIAEALSKSSGHRVELRVAHRGRGARLVRIAERNAAHALEDAEARRAGRRARFAPDILELQRALGLESPPYRMVCFDISNLGAEGAVAAIVASENGQARRGLYRRMRIRGPGPDDVGDDPRSGRSATGHGSSRMSCRGRTWWWSTAVSGRCRRRAPHSMKSRLEGSR